MAKSLRVVLVGSLFVLVFAYAGVNSYFFASTSLASGFPGWYVGRDGRVVVARFPAQSAASVLQNGDELVALNGQPFKNRAQYFEAFGQKPAGSSYTDNKQALLLALMLGLISVGGDPSPNLVLAQLPGALLVPIIPAYLISVLSLPVILHFFLIFPGRSAVLPRFPSIEYLIYLPWLLIVEPVMLLRAFVWLTQPARFWEISKQFTVLTVSSTSVLALYNLVALAVLAMNYRKANQPSRRRIRVIVAGSFVAFLPFIFLKLATFYRGEFAVDNLTTAISIIVLLLICLFPLSFAYAIARHQVIPVSLIIRRSVQYLLAKNALRLLLALPIIGLLITAFANPHRTLDEMLLHKSIYFYALAAAAILLALIYHQSLREWIDRKFFRESYNQDKILRDLIDDLKRIGSLPEMSRRVSEQVERALHPEHVYLFYREQDRRDLSLGYSSRDSSSELRIPEEFQLLRFVEYQGHALDFPFLRKTNLPPSEEDWLTELGRI